MKAKQLHDKSAKELEKDLKDNQKKLQDLKIDYKTKDIKNVKEIRTVKKNIARIMTIKSLKESSSQGVKNG